jgi:hypothetical protein
LDDQSSQTIYHLLQAALHPRRSSTSQQEILLLFVEDDSFEQRAPPTTWTSLSQQLLQQLNPFVFHFPEEKPMQETLPIADQSI